MARSDERDHFLKPLPELPYHETQGICLTGSQIELELGDMINSGGDLLDQLDRSGSEPLGDQLQRLAGERLERRVEAEAQRGAQAQPLIAYIDYLNRLPGPVQQHILDAVADGARSGLRVAVEIQFGAHAFGVQETTWYEGDDAIQVDLRFVLPEDGVPGH